MPEKHPSLPRLMIVSSGGEHLSQKGLVLAQAQALARSAPVIFQIREKMLDSASIWRLCRQIAPLVNNSGSILTINERFDIALASKAGGVHLPESSCPADVVRKAARELLTGQSVHSKAAALKATSTGLDYLLFGPVFHTPSKEPFGPPQGLERLREICTKVRIPVFAVGGITPDKVPACLECGAWGVAALTPFLDASSMPETIKRFFSYISI
ncbi:thiamine phosphate synthase [Chlorobaculum sp. MV4-Y]|jgi:thiamine-phosphate pyrophosphorylase|uniref:thiamine phosphate synthase n=1 Tax=Chlorobaculum sp. MV4-Y TaxID=2976335 RepID=UPI0021B07DB1|nr:thiamine phosphate synthase [Chlorobaculum sp. MV4-Y]UWX58615.1 thiamine phosphate synthase [Chlorobaculum sp. MV4-Y]